MTDVIVDDILLVGEENDVLSGLLTLGCDRIAVESIRVRLDILWLLGNIYGIIFGLGLTVTMLCLLSLLD